MEKKRLIYLTYCQYCRFKVWILAQEQYDNPYAHYCPTCIRCNPKEITHEYELRKEKVNV